MLFCFKMWRTIIITVILLYLYTTVKYVTSAPTYHYSARGPTYVLSNTPEVHHNKQPLIEAHNSTYYGSGPREEARAMCSVKTQEVNATANATITRRLHGVVTSRELQSAVQRLEVIIFGQMQQLWQSLESLRKNVAVDGRTSFPDRRTLSFRYRPGVE